MLLEERLAVLYVYTNGSHHAKDRYLKDRYESYTHGGVPIDTRLTSKARKDIEQHGIDWNKTGSAHEESIDSFQGTDHDSGTFHYYTVEIVSNSGNKYKFSLSIQYISLGVIFQEMNELKESELLWD